MTTKLPATATDIATQAQAEAGTDTATLMTPERTKQAIDIQTPTTNKGDIIVHNGGGNTRLPAGMNGQVLTVDSNEPTGLKYVDNNNFPTINQIGAYVLAYYNTSTNIFYGQIVTPTTYQMRPCNLAGGYWLGNNPPYLTGSWMCMGHVAPSSNSFDYEPEATLWQKVA